MFGEEQSIADGEGFMSVKLHGRRHIEQGLRPNHAPGLEWLAFPVDNRGRGAPRCGSG